MEVELKMNTVYQVDIQKITKFINLQVAHGEDIIMGEFHTARKFLVGDEHGYTWTDVIGEMFICYELPGGWRSFSGFDIETGEKYHVMRRRFGGDFLVNQDTFELLEKHDYVKAEPYESLVKNSDGIVRAVHTTIIKFLIEYGSCEEIG